MRALIQRSKRGVVSVDNETLGAISKGLVILVGVTHDDTEQEAAWLAQKIAHLRIFESENGKLDRSLVQIHGGALVISQFTLYGDTRKGRRPSFTEAAQPAIAEPLIEHFCERLKAEGITEVQTGKFGAHMLVEIENDGPVTLWLDTNISRSGNSK